MRRGRAELAVNLALVGLLVSGCTAVATPPIAARELAPGSTTTTSTVDTRPTTTATAPEVHLPQFHLAEFRLPGATPRWERTVANLYGPSCGGSREALSTELSELPAASDCPIGGMAATSSMGEIEVAAAAIGPDAVYGVDDGTGFRIVAARLPSLSTPDAPFAWYGVVPKVVVTVGSDARPGEDPVRARADSLHLVALDGLGGGGLIGIPRDSWVRIAGGRSNKINAALSTGGPDILLQTVADVTGLNLDGYVLTGFSGFQEMVGNVLGGLDIDLAAPVSDSEAGANLEAGLQYLNGPQALALARARKSLPGGDLSRQHNGGLLLLAALASAHAYGSLHLPTLITESAQWMTTDLTPAELLAFAALAIDTPIASIGNHVAPGRVGTAGSASVVYLSDSAPALFADLADGNLTP